MIVKIFTGPLNYDVSKLYTQSEDEYIIGVDSACKLLLDNNIVPDLGVGDFDSVTIDEFRLIKDKIKNLETHSSVKNYTDTYLAVKEAIDLDAEEIIIYGGLGNRLDHTFANINLLKLGPITIIDNYTKVYMIDPGEYDIKNQYKYVSFFAIEDVKNLTLTNFKYELTLISLDTFNPLCISNEGEGILSFTDGLLLVIHQNE